MRGSDIGRRARQLAGQYAAIACCTRLAGRVYAPQAAARAASTSPYEAACCGLALRAPDWAETIICDNQQEVNNMLGVAAALERLATDAMLGIAPLNRAD